MPPSGMEQAAKAAEASGKEYNEALEEKLRTPKELGSPRAQVAKGVINQPAYAGIGESKQIKAAQDAMCLLYLALEELPSLTAELFKFFRMKMARFGEEDGVAYSKLTTSMNPWATAPREDI